MLFPLFLSFFLFIFFSSLLGPSACSSPSLLFFLFFQIRGLAHDTVLFFLLPSAQCLLFRLLQLLLQLLQPPAIFSPHPLTAGRPLQPFFCPRSTFRHISPLARASHWPIALCHSCQQPCHCCQSPATSLPKPPPAIAFGGSRSNKNLPLLLPPQRESFAWSGEKNQRPSPLHFLPFHCIFFRLSDLHSPLLHLPIPERR